MSDAEGLAARMKSFHFDALHPLRPYKRIEIAASEDLAANIVDVINRVAHTGKKGDGIIWTLPLELSELI